MNISEIFIRRPVMTVMVMLTILMLGIIGFKKLPVSDLPNVDYPTIQVSVSYPGANPKTMANTCASPLEREFMTIEGMTAITSNSVTGSTTLILQFNLNKSLDSASIDVQSAIDRAVQYLPQDLPFNPTYQKVNPASTPILYLALTSDTMTQYELYDYANTYVGQRLNMVEGVSQVETYGAPYAARIQVDPEKLSAMKVGIDEVTQSLVEGNVDKPVGTLFGPKMEFTIDVNGQLINGEQYNNLAIKTKDGSIVKISEIGNALDSLQNDKYYCHFRTKNIDKVCVILAIRRQPGMNTVNIIKGINALLPDIKKALPSSLEYHTIYDQSDSIKESVKDVEMTLVIALILVVCVIYLILGKIFDTITPALSLPMTLIGTFAIMYLLNFSIDILSLMALTLSIGFLVDDAIVVLENNVRHVQMGLKPFEASISGSKEIGMTIVSMTICLAIVFIPMLFMGGVVGKLFTEFALTIMVAVTISGFISLSLTPLLCSRFIPSGEEEKKKGFMEKFADLMNEKMLHIYKKILTITMHHRKTMLLIGLCSIGASIILFLLLPKDFLPNEDVGFINGFTHARDGTSPFEMENYQKKIGDIVVKDKAVDLIVSVSSITSDNEGFLFIKMKPYKQRGPQEKIIKRLFLELYQIPGVNSFLSEVPLINLQVGQYQKGLYQYVLTSLDQKTLNQNLDPFKEKVQTLPGFVQVTSDLEISQPKYSIEIDRDRASTMNVTANKIEKLLDYSYSGGKVTRINGEINQYDVIIETLPKYYKDPEALNKLYISSSNNNLIPISELTKAKEDVGPLSINHLNGLPSSTITFNLLNTPLGDAVKNLEKLANEQLPKNITGKVLGAADVFKQAFATLPFLIFLTIFLIYIILGILYESFIHPITVLSTLPPAMFGGLFTLYIFGQTLSLYSFVGLIMLIGIVMKNGIMMVDFANEKIRLEKMAPFDAIFQACLLRFRPIMMTSIAALFGALPIALGLGGASAQSRISLGLVVVGGLFISQILTLFLTPTIYYYMECFEERVKALFQKKKKV